jgi:Fe2+ or Zn2+ uptake regulation protein
MIIRITRDKVEEIVTKHLSAMGYKITKSRLMSYGHCEPDYEAYNPFDFIEFDVEDLLI